LPGIANELIEISGSSALNMKAVAVGIVAPRAAWSEQAPVNRLGLDPEALGLLSL